MVPCDPYLQVPFPDGMVLPWWAERGRLVAEIERLSSQSHVKTSLSGGFTSRYTPWMHHALPPLFPARR